MVVDDDPVILTIVEMALIDLCSNNIDVFSNSVIALEHFRSCLTEGNENHTLVITDIWMPEMTGLELAAELLRLHPDLKIVFMSAFEQQFAANSSPLAPDLKHLHYLQKPFTIKALREIVKLNSLPTG